MICIFGNWLVVIPPHLVTIEANITVWAVDFQTPGAKIIHYRRFQVNYGAQLLGEPKNYEFRHNPQIYSGDPNTGHLNTRNI
jgi:hypothetical protein